MTDSATSKDPELKKRRSTRIIQAVPLTVTGVDALGRPFQERTSTLVVSCHGCRYQSKHYVLKNMWVTLEVPHPETGQDPRQVRGRVTWIQRPRTVRELFQIAVELEIPGNAWGIAFPPPDWFPFPETPTSEIPAPAAEMGAEAPADEWVLPGAAPHPDNLHVLPSPTGGEHSIAMARQVARLVLEAKQQLQSAVRESAAQAVTAETRPLLATLQNQLKEAAERAVKLAVGSYADELTRQTTAKIEEARQADIKALGQRWSSELQQHLQDAGAQLAEHLTKVASSHQASLEQQREVQFKEATEKLNELRSELAASAVNGEAGVARFRQQIDKLAEGASQRWREALESRVEEARTRLEKLEKAARLLQDEIASAVTAAQTGWRGRLDADLAAASARWNEKVGTSLQNAARQAAEQLARQSQTVTSKLEQELTLRVAALRQSFEQATTEAESTLGTLRTALSKETVRAKTSLAEIERAASHLDDHASRLDTLSQTAAAELQRRCEAIVATQSQELSRCAESAVAGMAERLQPTLEAAGHQSVTRLAAQLEQQLVPHVDRAQQLIEKLVAGEGLTEQAVQAHHERFERDSDQAVQAALARLQEAVGHFEKDFEEAGRAATAKWLAELEAKATDTTHAAFEALYKSAEWYEKKAQTHMQATMDKALEQASNGLRENAGEISGLFASELDHYSRTYVEHTQGQMDEAVKDAVERARGQLAQAADTTATTFGDQLHGAAQREFDRFTGSLSSAFEQTAARLETHMAQVCSKIDANARQYFVEFHKGMAEQVQRGVAQARQELEAQLTVVKDTWHAERDAQQQQFEEALGGLGNQSIDAYKKRLENVSNSWLLATATKLSQQSQDLIATLASSAEQQLRETCSQVFASLGEALRQRLLDFSARLPNSTPPEKK